MKLQATDNCKRAAIPILVAFLLGAITLLMHRSALNSFWRFDDGFHLVFAARFSPWQYFFDPEITRAQSGTNVTPWNVLTYDINLALFGLNQVGHYAHQLASLWLVSVATFFFLRLWTQSAWAFFGATLILLGAPTVHIAQELMTSHYIEGLLFVVLAMLAYVRAVREDNGYFALAGAFAYLLSVSCKEVYVPLVAVLPFLPVATFMKRVKFALPFAMVALAYVFWRFLVLGTLRGGQDPSFDPFALEPFLETFRIFMQLPHRLFGNDLAANIAMVGICIALAIFFAKNPTKLPLLAVGLLLLLLPIVPVAGGLLDTAHGRYLFFPWWGLCCFLALVFSQLFGGNYLLGRYGVVVLASAVGVLATAGSFAEYRAIFPVLKTHDVVTRFVLSSSATQLVFDEPKIWYPALNTARLLVDLEKELFPANPTRARIVSDPFRLSSLDITTLSVWGYDANCWCMTDITSSIPNIIARHSLGPLQQDALSVVFHYQAGVISWQFGPVRDGLYFIADTEGSLFFPLPREGTIVRAQVYLDALKSFYIYRVSPDGMSTRTPLLHFDPDSTPTMAWPPDKQRSGAGES